MRTKRYAIYVYEYSYGENLVAAFALPFSPFQGESEALRSCARSAVGEDEKRAIKFIKRNWSQFDVLL